MKISKLLVLSALFAVSVSSAKAGVPDGVWTMPEPQGLEFTTFTDDGSQYYLYNPGAKMFFASGNSWNTQASVRVYGYAFWLQEATEEGAPEGSYELWNYVENPQRTDVTGEHNVFFDGGSYWVDHGSQAGYTWNYVLNGDAVRFEVVTKPGFYIGWDGTYIDSDDASATCSSVLKNLDPATPGVCVDWKAVTPASYENFVYGDSYEAYCAGVKLYIASVGLKKALEDAEAVSLDCTASLAVYTNTSSTVEELRAAKDLVNARIALKKAIDAAKEVYVDVSAAEAVLADESTAIATVNKTTSDLNDITTAKQALKALIEECESKGYTETADAKAVLQNLSATKAEVEAATKALNEAYTAWGKTHASVDNPSDMTGMMVNPNFDNASNSGWSGTAPNMTGSGSHGPANVAEHWNKTFDTYQDVEGLPAGIYTLSAETSWRGTLENLHNGVTGSKLYVKIGEVENSVPFNNIWAPLNTTSLAGPTSFGTTANERTETDAETGVTYYIPDDPSCFRVYADKGWYDTKMMFKVAAGDKVRIGVALPQGVSSDNWSCFDTFALTFYGDGGDAWQLYVNEGWNYEQLELDEDEVLFTQSYLDAYNEAAAVDPSTLSGDAVKNAVLAVENAYVALQKNIDLWKQWKQAVEDAKNYVVDLGWTEPWNQAGGMGDYLYDVDDIEMDRELTNEELEEAIAHIAAMIKDCEEYAKEHLPTGSDVTRFVVNPDFELPNSLTENQDNPSGLSGTYGTATGWHADKRASGNFTPGPQGQVTNPEYNHCFEAWHCHDFDLWQEVSNLPEGIYQIFVQGYVRNEGPDNSPFAELPYVPVKLYLNNALNDFPDIYSENPAEEHPDETSGWSSQGQAGYPNSMAQASQCFTWGMYETDAFGPVKKGQAMRIGVKTVNMTTDWWCIFDNFRLKYQGYLPEFVKAALDKALLSVDIEGKLIGADVRENAAALIAQCNAFIADYPNHDAKDEQFGKQMFDVLYELYDVQPTVAASELLFNQLSEALMNLESALYEAQASQAVQNEAAALKNEIEDGMFNESLTDAQAQEYIEKINYMITQLALPDFSGASDDTPVNLTAAIKSASFEAVDEYDEKVNSSAGWTNPCNLGNEPNDSWNPYDQRLVFAMEQWHANIDMYQDIIGLPAGTYMLQIDAFCEISGASDTQDRANDSYNAWVENPKHSEAFLYGVDGEGITYYAPIVNLAQGAPKERPEFVSDIDDVNYALESEVKEVTIGEETYYWPTSLISGRYFLELGKAEVMPGVIQGTYTSKVYLKVKEDGKLRVGLKADRMADNGGQHWVVWDDFRLFYFGANSTKEVNGHAQSVESVTVAQPVKVEFFTLDGRKTTNVQKGIVIQKITLDNGTVVVRKVRK